MARGRVHHYHVAGEKQESFGSKSSETFNALCGKGYVFKYENDKRDHVFDATCPDCSKKWGKAELAKIADRLTLVPLTDEEKPGYIRSGFKLVIDGVHRGFVVNEFGWGKTWEIRNLGRSDWSKGIGGWVGQPHDYDKEKTKDDAPVRSIHRASRDAAASLGLVLLDGGFLPTLEDIEAKEAARKEARERADAERQRSREEHAQARINALETLASLRGRANALGLSNSDLAGLADMEKFL